MYVCIYMCGFVYVFNIKDMNNISIDIIYKYICIYTNTHNFRYINIYSISLCGKGG